MYKDKCDLFGGRTLYIAIVVCKEARSLAHVLEASQRKGGGGGSFSVFVADM